MPDTIRGIVMHSSRFQSFVYGQAEGDCVPARAVAFGLPLNDVFTWSYGRLKRFRPIDLNSQSLRSSLEQSLSPFRIQTRSTVDSEGHLRDPGPCGLEA